MNVLLSRLTSSPLLARVTPFALFLLFTSAQSAFGGSSRYWLYLVKVVLGAWMLWEIRPLVPEMRWTISWEGLVVGMAAFGIWVSLDHLLLRFGFSYSVQRLNSSASAWNPHLQFGTGSIAAWFFIGIRILGSSVVVPSLEEVFFRSFLYRFVVRKDFLSIPLGCFLWMPFLLTSLIFGLEHHPADWIAGILCGFAYQWLVIRKQRLGDALTAHAITNCLLGLWVVFKGAWQFW